MSKIKMRKYYLASTEHRNTVNLLQYKNIILETAKEILGSDIKVSVHKDYYMIPCDIPRGAIIKFGRALCKTPISIYCVDRPVLFKGEYLMEKNRSNKNISKTKRSIR